MAVRISPKTTSQASITKLLLEIKVGLRRLEDDVTPAETNILTINRKIKFYS